MKKTVLIVEDEKFLSELYDAKLSAANSFETVFAADGTEAIELIKTKKPDAIILDIIMPNLGGFAVLEWLRKEGNQTPVIVATNLDTGPDFDRAMHLGAADYFVKSNSSINDIIDKVKAVLGEYSTSRPAF